MYKPKKFESGYYITLLCNPNERRNSMKNERSKKLHQTKCQQSLLADTD